MTEKKYEDLTHRIIGCAMKIHSTLGNGFQEVIYQRCLAIELRENGIQYKREIEQPIFYDGHEVGTRRADFIVADKVMVELKAVIDLEDVHLAQGLNYLEAYRLDTGLLINFGARSLQFKRLYSRKAKSDSSSHPGNPENPVNPDTDTVLKFSTSNNPANPDPDNVLQSRESRS